MAELKATLTKRDERFLEQSLNGSMWKVILAVGAPLALYQGLNQFFTILDTMMASHISKESVSAVAYLSQLNLMLSALGGGLVMIAVASLLSQLALFGFALKNSLSGDGAFSFSREAVAFDKVTTGPMIRQSIPVITEKALFAFGKTVVNAMSTLYGATMVGAMGVSNNLGGITTNPQNGFQEGAAAVISQNYGAGKHARVLRAFYTVLLVNMALGALISGLELWQLDWLARFFDSGSAAFHREIVLVYRFEALGAVPLGVNAAVLALLYGLGKTELTLMLNFARVFIFRIPVFWFLQHCTNLGEMSAGVVMLVSNLSSGVLAAIISVIVIRRYRKQYAIMTIGWRNRSRIRSVSLPNDKFGSE